MLTSDLSRLTANLQAIMDLASSVCAVMSRDSEISAHYKENYTKNTLCSRLVEG